MKNLWLGQLTFALYPRPCSRRGIPRIRRGGGGHRGGAGEIAGAWSPPRRHQVDGVVHAGADDDLAQRDAGREERGGGRLPHETPRPARERRRGARMADLCKSM